jgi:hypothetical protein
MLRCERYDLSLTWESEPAPLGPAGPWVC